MRFGRVDEVRIPRGSATKGSAERIRYGDKVLWSLPLARYISLGDSIAVGHAINGDWEKDYGWDAQYGVDGRKETVIVPNSYTDLIRRDLAAKYNGKITAISFARSGDKVDDLIEKLNHATVQRTIAKADYVTICIGANNVLGPTLDHIQDYFLGDGSALNAIQSQIEINLAALADDNNPNSYTALFKKLSSINPYAHYVFTTIYNPYKYLYLEEGSQGFFKPLLDTIPQMTILGFEVDEAIKNLLLDQAIVKRLFSRANVMCDYAEDFVTRLNAVLRDRLNAYGNSNFMLADTKALFDLVPDRPVPAEKHYNDLVNVEFTRGFDVAEMDWGTLWKGSNAATFWTKLALKHTSFSSGLDIGGLAAELMPQVLHKVIEPDIDPHPEEYGHEVLKTSFESCYTPGVYSRRVIT